MKLVNPLGIITKPWSPRFKWLAGWSAVYGVLAFILSFTDYFGELMFLQIWWIITMSAPFWDPRVKRFLKMDKPIPKDQW